jgi:hypothetical protein
MKKIIFTNTTQYKALELPKPASKYIADWYKETNSYTNNEKKPFGDGSSPATIKKCMPVFDAMTSGYIIESPADVYVHAEKIEYQNEDESSLNPILQKTQEFSWSLLNLINFHPLEQAPKHPYKKEDFRYPKWDNPWGIKTPRGYSTLFVQPFHRESVFTILPGIVDTDSYFSPVNFPFVINDPDFDGLIPKGTPIAQVIPFKRDRWKNSLGNENDRDNIIQNSLKLQTKFFDKYKSMFWEKKNYE